MKKRNKIIFVIMSVILILSTMVLPVFASSFQQNDKMYGTISSQISSPYSNVGVGDLSIVIEALGVTYIGELPQSFTGITNDFAERIKNPPTPIPTNATTSSTGLIQCTQVGNTNNRVQFNYTSTYQYTYAIETLTHTVYFWLENNGVRTISNINKLTIIVEDAFTKSETKHWLSAVYNATYPSQQLYKNASEIQPPKYKYEGCAQFTNERDLYGRIRNNIQGNMWKENVLSAGNQTVRYSYNYGTTFYDERTDQIENLDYGFVKYNEIPIYNPNDVQYLTYFDSYLIDPNTVSVIQITDEAYPDRFFEQTIKTTNIISETIDDSQGFTDWIMNAVGGVFAFYITPWISLGDMLELCIVIGLFMVILKVFLGG